MRKSLNTGLVAQGSHFRTPEAVSLPFTFQLLGFSSVLRFLMYKSHVNNYIQGQTESGHEDT